MSAEFSCITLYLLDWVNFLLEAIYLGCVRPRQTRSHLCDMQSKGFYFSAVLLYLAPCYTRDGAGNMLAPRIRDSHRVGMETYSLLWSPRSSKHLFLGVQIAIISPLPASVCAHTLIHSYTHQRSMWNDPLNGLLRGGRRRLVFISLLSMLVIPQGANSLTHPDMMPGILRLEDARRSARKGPGQKGKNVQWRCSKFQKGTPKQSHCWGHGWDRVCPEELRTDIRGQTLWCIRYSFIYYKRIYCIFFYIIVLTMFFWVFSACQVI